MLALAAYKMLEQEHARHGDEHLQEVKRVLGFIGALRFPGPS